MAYIEALCEPDDIGSPSRSVLRIYEDGVELGPSHSLHADIRSKGEGRFSHWTGLVEGLSCLFFSASDNTDPNMNNKQYEVDMGDGRLPLAIL